MSIYVIGDLHLSFGTNKPMNVFGEAWQNHEEKIKIDWLKKVKNTDTVLLLGDFSWAMQLQETIEDFKYLCNMPGKKILLKGNHDYWWTTVTNMKNFLKENKYENIDFLYNNSYCIDNTIIVGTRGWLLTDSENGEKMTNRETIRLELSIQDGIKKYGEDKKIIVCMHYPPLTMQNKETVYTKLMQKYPQIKECYYGHLHGPSHKEAQEGKIGNIEYHLISSDYLDFKLLKI